MLAPSFRPVFAGGQLSASELNRAFAEIARSTRLIVDAPLQLTQDGAGNRLRIRANGRIYVRITGQGSGSGTGSARGSGNDGNPLGLNCYSGVEQWSTASGVITDAPTGMIFDSATYPLVEMSGAEDVPVDAVAIATMANDETHWEFLWNGEMADESPSGSGSGGSGSGQIDCNGIPLGDIIQCTEDGSAIRTDVCLAVRNGRLIMTDTQGRPIQTSQCCES